MRLRHNANRWSYGHTNTVPPLSDGTILVSSKNLNMLFIVDPATNEVVWRYVAKDDFTSFYSPHMGGVQRLPSGNTLICEGNKGCVFEVTPNGDIVREFVSPHFVQTEDFGALNWLFRCRWYAADSAEIKALGRSVAL